MLSVFKQVQGGSGAWVEGGGGEKGSERPRGPHAEGPHGLWCVPSTFPCCPSPIIFFPIALSETEAREGSELRTTMI